MTEIKQAPVQVGAGRRGCKVTGSAFEAPQRKEKTLDPIPRLLDQVRVEDLRDRLLYLCEEPLPFRKLNHTVPGHGKCSLYEADDFIAGRLEAWGYEVEREKVSVQAFRRDTSKPLSQQYSPPEPSDAWYEAFNLYAKKTGRVHPDEVVVVISHKDSQSWIDSPGAYDNAVGTVGNMEIARVLAPYASQRTLWFVFCNEEHTRWTSVTMARNMAEAGLNVVAVLNMDSIGGKSQEDADAGRKTNVTRYTTPEGERLADLMAELNQRYRLGLAQSKYFLEQPGDDDGSFIRAGFPASVLSIGSYPYADPEYHTAGDTAQHVDVENVAMATRLSLAFVLHLDVHGVPEGAH